MRSSHREASRRGLSAIAFAASLLFASTSDAGFVIVAPNVSAARGSSGSFDVLIENTNPTGGVSYSVGTDVLQLALAGTSGVTFTGVSIATASPYLYLTSGTTQGGGALSTNLFPNTSFTAADSEFSSADSFQRTILAGQTFGLVHVSYTVAANASASSGMIDVVVNPDGSATSLADVNGSAVGFTVTNGLFSIASATVPEPSAVLLTATGLAIAFLGRRRSSRAASRPESAGEVR